MSWVVKKAFAQAKVMCDRHGLAKVTSKSSFLADEPERRIRGAIVGILGPEVHYLFIYWACGLIRGQGFVQE